MNTEPKTSSRGSRMLVWSVVGTDEHGNPTYASGPYRARQRYQDGRPDGWVYTDPDGNDHDVDRLRDAELAAEVHYGRHGARPQPAEKRAQKLARMKRKRGVLGKLLDQTMRCAIPALIVQGPAGCGKSYPAEQRLEIVERSGRAAVQLGGSVTPVVLYSSLYEVRDQGVLLIDDADSIYRCEESLNLLKHAVESKPVRTLAWNKLSTALAKEGIPRSFDFTGSVIFITNLDLDRVVEKGTKMSPHISALQSRALYLSLEIDSTEDLVVWIEHVVHEGGMLDQHGIRDPRDKARIVQYIADNADRLRSLSLREVMKLAGLYRSFGGPEERDDWIAMVEETMIKKDKRRA